MYGFSPAPVREETVSTLTVEETEELLLALLKSAIESIIQHYGDSVKDNLTFLHFSGNIHARRSNGEEEQTEKGKQLFCFIVLVLVQLTSGCAEGFRHCRCLALFWQVGKERVFDGALRAFAPVGALIAWPWRS